MRWKAIAGFEAEELHFKKLHSLLCRKLTEEGKGKVMGLVRRLSWY